MYKNMKLVPFDWIMAKPQNDKVDKILESTKLSNREKMIKFNENLRKSKLKPEILQRQRKNRFNTPTKTRDLIFYHQLKKRMRRIY